MDAEVEESEVEASPTTAKSSRWLWVGALLVTVIPVIVGLVLLRGDDSTELSSVGDTTAAGSDDMSGGDMGGSTEDEAVPQGVGDFAEVQASEITFDFDPDAGAVTLSVDTTIDMACAVVYGPTADLGSLATDTDMAGGAHANHHPRMVGLSAGVVWYRLQGIAADGSLYQSELMQFQMPKGSGDGATAQPPLPNVAGEARVTDMSSEYSDAYAARNAIDGDLTTEWSSAGDGDDAYIVLDFGENMHIKGIGFRTREMTDGTSITNSFTVTVDGKTLGPFEAGPGLAVALFDASGQVVRIDVETSTGGNTGAVEVEVYAEPEM